MHTKHQRFFIPYKDHLHSHLSLLLLETDIFDYVYIHTKGEKCSNISEERTYRFDGVCMLIVSERNEKESARDYAYRVIRSNIIELHLAPGTGVSESSLCDELQISRTPVREALADLARQKLVDIVPQKGTTVSLIDPKMVKEGHFLRSLVEQEIVAKVASSITEKGFRELESNVLMQEYHAQHNSVDNFVHLDNEFHSILFRLCDKEATYHVVTNFQTHFDRERKLSLKFIPMEDLVKDHRMILETLKERNRPAAKKAMKAHLAHVLVDQKKLIKSYPQYFKTIDRKKKAT